MGEWSCVSWGANAFSIPFCDVLNGLILVSAWAASFFSIRSSNSRDGCSSAWMASATSGSSCPRRTRRSCRGNVNSRIQTAGFGRQGREPGGFSRQPSLQVIVECRSASRAPHQDIKCHHFISRRIWECDPQILRLILRCEQYCCLPLRLG